MKKIKSFYRELGERLRHAGAKEKHRKAPLARVIRQLRTERKMTGAELCRKSGALDPRTLTALEKGRIRNPSLQTLETVALGLGLKVSDLFRHSEIRRDRSFYAGTQKGFFQMDFPAWGIKVVSFTPLIQEFFCGKFIFGSRKRLEGSLLPDSLPVFASVLVGRFEVLGGNEKLILKEGENFFLKGGMEHSFHNLLEREAVLLVVTAPSFLGSRDIKGLPIFSRKR